MPQISRDITEITRCGAQYRTEQFAPMGLKACHGSYLLEICANPGISQEQLARSICINKSNIARQAAALEEDGFILRKPCGKDKRITRLYPTDKTLSLLPRLTDAWDSWEALLTQDLTEEEKALVADLLVKMNASARQWMEER